MSQHPTGELLDEACLSVRALSVRLGLRTVVERLTFDVARGTVLAVVGPNGAGKSTLLSAIAGLVPHEGAVSVRGRPLGTFELLARSLSLVPDELLLPDEMSLGLALGLTRANPFAEPLGVLSLLSARASEVSRGEAKRAQLAVALASHRDVLLLDEPFGALDPRQLRDLWPTFREATRARAVVVSVHQMPTAALIADRILLLAGGKALALGTLDELRERAGLASGSLDEVFLALVDRADEPARARA